MIVYHGRYCVIKTPEIRETVTTKTLGAAFTALSCNCKLTNGRAVFDIANACKRLIVDITKNGGLAPIDPLRASMGRGLAIKSASRMDQLSSFIRLLPC